MARPTRTRVVLAVVVLLVGAAVSWFVGRDDRPQASPGDTFAWSGPLTDTRSTYVLLPTGRLDVVATAVRDDLDTGGELGRHQAPGGGGFVGLQLAMAGSDTSGFGDPRTHGPAVDDGIIVTSQDRLADTVARQEPPDPHIVLVAGGRRYPVRALTDDGKPDPARPPVPHRVAVAVDGVPDDVLLEVGFAGRTQTVDLRTGARRAGSFAPLYANRPIDRSCGTPSVTSGFATDRIESRCRVDWRVATPWYPDLGWAPAGRTWLGVGVAVSPPSGFALRTSRGSARYEASPNQGDRRVTLGGGPPRGVRVVTGSDGEAGVVIFPVPRTTAGRAGELRVRVPWECTRRRDSPSVPGAGYLRTVTTEWRVAV